MQLFWCHTLRDAETTVDCLPDLQSYGVNVSGPCPDTESSVVVVPQVNVPIPTHVLHSLDVDPLADSDHYYGMDLYATVRSYVCAHLQE